MERNERFLHIAEGLKPTLFEKKVTVLETVGGVDYVDLIVDTLSGRPGSAIQINGLPGCAKNMLIQLAYYKMLENFMQGKSNCLPIYLSSSYYEKQRYTCGREHEEMTACIKDELTEYFGYL